MSCAGKRIGRALPVLAILAGLTWVGNKTVGAQQIRVRSTDLPEAFDGLRIAQISDLHGQVFGPENQWLMDLLWENEPDLIAVTGDLAEDPEHLSALPSFLKRLVQIAPVYYVTGNHEWSMSRKTREEFFDILGSCGVVRLENEYRLLEKGGQTIVLAGVDDPNGPLEQKTPRRLVSEIRSEHPDAFVLMLSHRNDQMELWKELGVQLVLTGHAHGGVIRLPGIGGLLGTHYELFPDYTDGLYREDGTNMVVSRGLGESKRVPIRVFNRPQVPIIVLKKEG